jgi:GPI ethanolamine phosphate transferase 3 subunit O
MSRQSSRARKKGANRGSIIHILGIYFFTKGFLLTRLILDHKSACEAPPADAFHIDEAFSHTEGCWYPKKFSKAVVIIIDALRYDFTVPFLPSSKDTGPRQFHNAFPVLYDTAESSPEKAFLLPFIADPPTTTLQRLKGLTTGTLPTFIDAGSNFAGTAIEEDNLLAQMRALGKTIVHLGDDTWQSLFPGYFDQNLSHPYDSFNVWDLHTVDDGVIWHLLPLMNSSHETKWDFVFAHFLGVDHAGHRYGPDHPAMKDKLEQMNRVLLQTMEALDESTVLVVLGDHGMDTKGDHGGESDEEVEAALWMYSKRPVFGRTHADFVSPPESSKIRPVRQTDLVSTLSLLLGLPIPFNNIGAPIEEAFARPDGPDWRALAIVNQIAVAQIQTYQEQYSKARHLGSDPEQHALYHSAMSLLKSAVNTSKYDKDLYKESYAALRTYEATVLNLYRRLWANFKLRDMVIGVIILVCGLLLSIRLSIAESEINAGKLVKAISVGMVIGCFAALVGDVVLTYQLRPFTALLGSFFGSLVAALPLCFLFYPANPTSLLPRSLWSWLAIFFTMSQAIGFASNSYTIHEDSILLFFLTTLGIMSCAASLRRSQASDRYLGVVHSISFTLLTRLASFSRLCREEQMPGCRSTFYASSNSSISAPWQIFIPFIIAILLPAFVKARYSGTASYFGPARFWLGFCFRIGLLLIAIYWTIDAADNAGWLGHVVSSESLKKVSLAASRSAIGIAIVVGMMVTLWGNPCLDVTLAIPNQLKGQAEDEDSHQKPAVTILGYANVYGAGYFLLLPIFILLVSVLLPHMGQFSIAICTCQILCLLEILDTNGLTVSGPSMSNNTTAIGPIVLAMLGSFHFFKTGHQATLASIQWNAAFVPFRTITYPWSPLLIILNTFGPQIICAAAVPLTVLWKRPVSRDPGWMRDMMRDVMSAVMWHVLYYATIQLATTMWAGHLRRHLMLYRVFMPRFLMSSALLVVIDMVILFIVLGMIRVNTLNIGKVMGF